MYCRELLPLALLLSNVSPGLADDNGKGDAKKLQGTWRVTKFIDQSEEAAPADQIKDFTFEFREGLVTLRRDKDSRGSVLKYTLNASKQPKWIDIEFGCPGENAEGIYRLAGDELSICIVAGTRGGKAAPRPSQFKASKRDKYSLFILKRVK